MFSDVFEWILSVLYQSWTLQNFTKLYKTLHFRGLTVTKRYIFGVSLLAYIRLRNGYSFA